VECSVLNKVNKESRGFILITRDGVMDGASIVN